MKNKRLPELPARAPKAKILPVAGERFSDKELNNIRRGIAARILEVFGDNDAETARRCLTTGATIAKYTKAERFPNAEILLRMRQVAGINIHWLLTGEGRQFVVNDVKEYLTEEEKEEITLLAENYDKNFLEMIIALALAQLSALKRLD